MVHSCSPGSLHWMQVLKRDGTLKELVGNHREGIHIHLRLERPRSYRIPIQTREACSIAPFLLTLTEMELAHGGVV